MSVLVKGMDMPEYGKIMVVYPGGYTKIYMRSDMVEVPTPHGDLVDRKELLNDAGGVYTARPEEAQKIQREINKVLFAIKDAPAVIEAEGE